MATNSSGTVDIAVYVTQDKNILSFIVQDEYHLKKLAVGAYSINVLDTQLLNDINTSQIITMSCGDYVIVYNYYEQYKKFNIILFNIKPTVLKKGSCIFKLIQKIDDEHSKMSLSSDRSSASHSTQEKSHASFSPSSSSLSSGVVLNRDNHVHSSNDGDDNSELFRHTFGDNTQNVETTNSNDGRAQEREKNGGEYQTDEEPMSKRQKLDNDKSD